MSGYHGLYGAILRRSNVICAALALVFVAAVTPARAELRLLALGDSLTAGYNLPPDASFPAQLEKALRAKGHTVKVINAGVSGDTTSGALTRLDWALADRPSHALVALGANDMLRGLSPEAAQQNIERIVARLQQAGVKVMLAGMRAAPNLGPEYGRRFDGIYPAVAAARQVPLYPFFLDGVAAERRLNLDDGMHPNREGVNVMVSRILPHIERFIGSDRN